jgi:hypothetical protein
MTSASNRAPAVDLIRSPLKLEYWKAGLADHPDPDFAARIINQISEGIPIGYQGNKFFHVSKNWPSVDKYHDQVRENILANAARGRVDGPYKSPPHKSFRGSPLGAFPKKRSTKIRVIHDLSWPPTLSINEFINRHDYTFSYTSVDEAVKLCQKYETPWMCKVDLKDAYMHCMVRPQDRHLLGFTWEEKGETEYWMMCALPFGMSSSPKLFNDFGDALEYMMKKNGASQDTIHFCDDFFSVKESQPSCGKNLSILLETIHDAGMDAQEEKTDGPDRVMEFLGIIIDTIRRILCISPERLCEIKAELAMWGTKKVCSKRDLLSLLGKLIFCARVVRDGRKFVGRLIELAKKVSHLHYKVKLNKEAQADIAWWAKCIDNHNGVSMFPVEWDINDSVVVYTDASDLAAGGACGHAWFVVPFTGEDKWMSCMDIAWRELFAMVVCIATFGKKLSGQRVSMKVDNQAIFYCVNNGKSKNPKIMALIRSLYYYTTLYKIEYKAFYLSTHDNILADAISRLGFDQLRNIDPDIDVLPTEPVNIMYDF